jgi:hypothetical protein
MSRIVEVHFSIQEQGNVGCVACYMRVARSLGVTLRLASRFDTIQEITHMESRRVVPNLFDLSTSKQRWGA